MTTEPTKEMIALARDVYSRFIIDNTPGAGPSDVPRFDDKAHGVGIALAAIQATTELAAELANRYGAAIQPFVTLGDDDSIHLTDFQEGERRAASVIRIKLLDADHLKETPDV